MHELGSELRLLSHAATLKRNVDDVLYPDGAQSPSPRSSPSIFRREGVKLKEYLVRICLLIAHDPCARTVKDVGT